MGATWYLLFISIVCLRFDLFTGTGKTYTISLSLLRLIEAERRQPGVQSKIIFITAVTHAAIQACWTKLVSLIDSYLSFQHLSNNWLKDVRVELVTTGNDHPGPILDGHTVYIYMGTIFQVSWSSWLGAMAPGIAS